MRIRGDPIKAVKAKLGAARRKLSFDPLALAFVEEPSEQQTERNKP